MARFPCSGIGWFQVRGRNGSISGAKQCFFFCPESRDLGCSFGLSFWVRELFLGSRIEDKVATLEAPVLFSNCVSFLGGGLSPRHSGSVWNYGSGIF